jgi:hypothetical protein
MKTETDRVEDKEAHVEDKGAHNAQAPEIHRVGDLEIDQDLKMQHRIWKVQRIGWGVMALVVFAMLLGLTGRGPLSHATAGSVGSPLHLEYERFARCEAPMDLHIHLAPGVAHDGKARLWISREYLEALAVEQISPEQEKMQVYADRHVFEFDLPDAQQAATIVLKLRPQKIGTVAGRVGIENGSTLSFQHFIYP